MLYPKYLQENYGIRNYKQFENSGIEIDFFIQSSINYNTNYIFFLNTKETAWDYPLSYVYSLSGGVGGTTMTANLNNFITDKLYLDIESTFGDGYRLLNNLYLKSYNILNGNTYYLTFQDKRTTAVCEWYPIYPQHLDDSFGLNDINGIDTSHIVTDFMLLFVPSSNGRYNVFLMEDMS